ncbi:hypothetical protein K492DRAFT_157571 [Lichtheimia hyalospora FSU 10163]|nr:hypothetical protein K492DRAFT_157571 [Lichtheimia hyalospora FSU 10163]
MSFARSLLPLVRPTIKLTRPTCQQRTKVLTMSRMINTAAASQSAGSGNLSSMVYHFRRQQHLPYFLEYLMWVILGSEALHLMWLKMEKKEYKEKTQHKIKLLEEIIDRIEKGQTFTDDFREEIRIVLKSGRLQHQEEEEDVDDDYLDKLLALHEQQEERTEDNTAISEPSSEDKTQSTWPTQDDNGDKKKKAFFL